MCNSMLSCSEFRWCSSVVSSSPLSKIARLALLLLLVLESPAISQTQALSYPSFAEVQSALEKADEAFRSYAEDIGSALKVTNSPRSYDNDLLGLVAARQWIKSMLGGKVPINTSSLLTVLVRLDDLARNASIAAFDLYKQDVAEVITHKGPRDTSRIVASNRMVKGGERLYQASTVLHSLIERFSDSDQIVLSKIRDQH